jgi:hypothetical protein
MGITLGVYKKRIKRIIKEILEQDPNLNEIFDSPPFKADFNFKENIDEVYVDDFLDPKNNKIKIYFYKSKNNCYLLDFTINGQSGKDNNIIYSLKDYTSLVGTIAKALTQFLEEYKPNAVKIDGEDTFQKQDMGKGGQKTNIYHYFASKLGVNPNYMVSDRKPDGSFNLSRKLKT